MVGSTMEQFNNRDSMKKNKRINRDNHLHNQSTNINKKKHYQEEDRQYNNSNILTMVTKGLSNTNNCNTINQHSNNRN
jgi:hypothetical protein